MRLLAAITLPVFALLSSHPAAAQCTAGPIVKFPSSLAFYPRFYPGYTDSLDIFSIPGGRHLIQRENFGYSLLDVTNPSQPSWLGYYDIEQQPGYSKDGDGFNTVERVGAAADGSRILVSYKETTHGTLLMSSAGGNFTFGGEYNPAQCGGGVSVAHVGNRYIGFSLQTSAGLVTADVTSFVPGLASMHQNSIPAELVTGLGGVNFAVAGDRFAVYSSFSKIVVVDVSRPGPIGAIASGFSVKVLLPSDFGLPAGTSLSSVAAAIHPVDGRLYVFTEAQDGLGRSQGMAVVTSGDGVSFTTLGASYLPPAPWSGLGSASPGVATFAATSNDLFLLTWARTTSPAKNKLVTFSMRAWGTDLTPNLTYDPLSFPDPCSSVPGTSVFPQPAVMRAFVQNGTIYAMLGTTYAGFSLPLTCSSPPAPPIAGLVVEPDPCPGGAASCPLASGAAVFVGDKLKITPVLDPPPSVKPTTSWRVDLDFHASVEDAGGYPRIKFPDASVGSLPSSFALVGPCDPANPVGGVNAATGANCWTSVVSNQSLGGPDFGPNPAPGSTHTLTIAFEAANTLGPSGLARFDVLWKIPTVRLRSTSVRNGRGVVDASEGHPSPTGYAWYFGSAPGAPIDEVLTKDASCAAPTCIHTFPPGNARYNYFVEVPWPNGYRSASCGTPCTTSLGTLNVTDLTLSFTAPATLTLGNSTFDVTSTSDLGSTTACGSGYQYAICDTSEIGCTEGSGLDWRDASISGGKLSLPTPPKAGHVLLRLRYRYATTSGGCSSPKIETWTPNVTGQGDPTAWPLDVSGCFADEHALCLNRQRFRVTAHFKNYNDGTEGDGHAVSFTPIPNDSGYFWFFSSSNMELIVKVLDARTITSNFWVIYGALSDVEYTITVSDTVLGSSKTYHNPPHVLASVADTNALPGSPSPGAAETTAEAFQEAYASGAIPTLSGYFGARSARETGEPGVSNQTAKPDVTGACTADATTLCLASSRFSAKVAFTNYNDGSSSAAHAIPITSDSGCFWFFQSTNVELALKVLDGRAVNGKFWVLYGALSDVEYTITITDNVTGSSKTYHNPAHNLASVADTSAITP